MTRRINRWVFSSLVALALTTYLNTGCSTTQTPDAIAYKTVASITTTVDTARQAWNTYVQQGHATVDQVTKVASGYAVYQQSVATAQIAITAYKANGDTNALNNAIAALSASSSSIVGIINSIVSPALTTPVH